MDLEGLQDEGKVALDGFILSFGDLVSNRSIQALASVSLEQGLEHFQAGIPIALGAFEVGFGSFPVIIDLNGLELSNHLLELVVLIRVLIRDCLLGPEEAAE